MYVHTSHKACHTVDSQSTAARAITKFYKNFPSGASLVAQWLRICLPTQGTRVQVLVWEDPTCHGATKPVSHNY